MTEEKLNKANELQHKVNHLKHKIDDISNGENVCLNYFSYGIHFETPLSDTIVKVIVEHLEKELSEAKKEFEEL